MTLPVPSTYKKLLDNITRYYETARRSLSDFYWNTGRDLVEVEQKGEVRARYGGKILEAVSQDLTLKLGPGFSLRNLRNMRRYFLAHKIRQPAAELPLTHQLELLSVQDIRLRKALEQTAVRENLTKEDLRKLIRSKHAAKKDLPRDRTIDVTPLAAKRGKVNTYQIKAAADTGWPDLETLAGGPGKGSLVLDQGFRAYRALGPEAAHFKAGDIVEIREGRLVRSERTAKDLFTYRALLQKVIDGDTFWMALDTGLGNLVRQKFRLRGIDCPEIHTAAGKAAKHFAESLLKKAEGITVCSSKNDKYDRYDADIFVTVRSGKTSTGRPQPNGHEDFKDKQGKEIFLNQILLDTAHAIRIKA